MLLSNLMFAQSSNTRTFSLSHLFSISNIDGASISPDGSYAAVVIERPRKYRLIHSYRGVSFGKDLWLLDIENGAINMILDGAKDSSSYWNPVWSPDSKHLAVLSTKGGDNIKAYSYDLKDGLLTQIHPNGVNLMTKTYQGKSGFNDPYLWLDSENLIVSLLPKGQSYNTFQMDYLPFKTITEEWQNAKYNIQSTSSTLDTDSLHIFPNDQHSFLIKFNLNTNNITPLDSGYFRHVILSPSKKILYVVKRNGAQKLGGLTRITSAWNFNHKAGLIDLTTDKKYYVPTHDLNPIATSGKNPHLWTNNSQYVMIKNSNRQYAGFIDVRKNQFQQFEEVFTTAKEQEQDLFLKSDKGWYKFNEKNGNLRYLLESPPASKKEENEVQGTELDRNDKQQIVLYKYRDDTGLNLILDKNGSPSRIFTLNQWISEISPVEKEIIEFTDKQGNKQKALLLLSNHSKSKGLVVSCYPGTIIRSHSLNRDYRFSDNFLNPLVLTSNGYHVLIPTIDTKSTDEFSEFKDFVLPAVETTLEKKQLNESKVAILGLSHGGYLVYSIISQTNTFSSAIALAGYGNAFTLYGNFDMRYRYTQNPFENVGRLRSLEQDGYGGFGVPPPTDPNKYLKNSPALYTKNITTPLLIVQGDKDFVSIEQGEEIFTYLYRQGKKARFLRFWGEGHNISSPKNIEEMWGEILSWLEQTLE